MIVFTISSRGPRDRHVWGRACILSKYFDLLTLSTSNVQKIKIKPFYINNSYHFSFDLSYVIICVNYMNFSKNHLLSLLTPSVIFPIWICFYSSFHPVSLSTISLSFSMLLGFSVSTHALYSNFIWIKYSS